jgi:hypothetical protein
MLEALARSDGACVLYTHLGKVRDPDRPFGTSAQTAFRQLAALRAAGTILVTTTYRLLRYLTVRDHVRVSASRRGGHVAISIGRVEDPQFGAFEPSPDDLIGLTFAVDRCDAVTVKLASGDTVRCDVVSRGDTTVASVAWRSLVFPSLT